MKRIIFFGNQQALIDCIEITKSRKNAEVVAVVGCETEQDRLDKNISIEEYCKKNKLLYYNPDKLDDNFLSIFKKLKPDICFSVLYRKIFKQEYIKVPKEGFISFHPSLLPKYRGAVPRLWALLNGEKESGVTLHYIDDEGIDTGDMFAQKSIKIPDDISGYDFNIKLMKVGAQLFEETIDSILTGTVIRTKQDHSQATYYGMFNPKVRYIDWYQPTRLILRKINALTHPYSGAIACFEDGRELIIWKAEIFAGDKKNLKGPARIINQDLNGAIIVSTIDGYLKISEYSLNFSEKKFAI